MPLADDDVIIQVACGKDAFDRWHCGIVILVSASALWPLGLHPDQPLSRMVNPSAPKWWHAEAERRIR
jgi:hypothetical protein